ncbi:hypothetical protein H010_08201 [Hydrogenophaga taeniospiralis CCUG 15921]|uniref:DUF3570 domain-containing protein n=1 Tax=Hydrogenophaga taeniospiralis CCUG 15921 TaxID=1281780 RepID=A0A9X4NRB0_9BURK|nr:DUF3570 domain-containing protein [Hydrogenophaga taeniospiralis]MDG5975224.1 hypothetical protein [Hydrogenophaga taeniospiralis CCUG 15921]
MNTNTARKSPSCGSVLMASLVLPGMTALVMATPGTAVAESAPENTTLALKYGNYAEWQSGLDRISVNAPQFYLLAPIAGEWSIEASGVVDSVSGATPRLHTQRSGASRMTEERKAGDVKVTRYLSRSAYSVGIAYSDEHDYTSQALGLQGRWSTEDNNRTYTLGLGFSSDRIDNQSNGVNTAINRHKRTADVMAGVTQVLTPNDIVQFNLTRGNGSGYFNDPYKSFDERPDHRNSWISLARWNHHLAAADATVRSSYRYYSDTFGVRSHTVDMEVVKRVGRWTFTPGLRYYTQSAASFYFDPVFDGSGRYDEVATLTRASSLTGFRSGDQRLAAFGAVTASMKLGYALTPRTTVDLKLDAYRQATSLRLGGQGSPGLTPLNARLIQVGIAHKF